jgi:predicted naringenin-chalcone synthase
MTALYVAKTIIEADTTGRAVVLLACAEACSVHLSAAPQLELVIGNTIFGDGAACAIVTHAGFRGTVRTPPQRVTRNILGTDWEWAIGAMSSEIVPNSESSMTWKQSDEGGRYNMWLSRDIPAALTGFFITRGIEIMARVGILNPFGVAWALHPGGKGILTGFEKALKGLGLGAAGIDASHAVLREHGNMSSATILFVLQRVLSETDRDHVFFAGFGPGLTVEFGALHRQRREKNEISSSSASSLSSLSKGERNNYESESASSSVSASSSGDDDNTISTRATTISTVH